MINAIIKGIFKIVILLVNVLTAPIDLAIQTAFPDITNAFNYLDSFFDFINNLIGYVMSWFHLPQAFLTLLVGYWTFKLTVPHLIHRIKLAIAWYDKIKP